MKFVQRGFTMVELVIVVAIIGVLASIVYPSYTNYVVRANRVDAKVALSTLAQLQERYYTENLAYTDDFNDLVPGVAISDETDTLYVDDSQGSLELTAAGQDYKITLSGSATSYTFNAIANSDRQKKDDNCKTFTLQHTGLQTSLDKDDAASSSCWDR